VRDKRLTHRFSSSILPKYKRKTQNIERLIPELYLRGISTNNFPEALSAIFGENAPGLSATNILRMKEIWEKEYQEWNARRFDKIRYAYLWADGIYFNVRLGRGSSMSIGINRGDRRRPERTRWNSGWYARKQAILEGFSSAFEVERIDY
jgi:transposase-like protein